MRVHELAAIDVHTHVHRSVAAPPGPQAEDALFAYFGGDIVHPSVPDLAAYYRQRKMACVAFTIDATTATGRPPAVSNEEIADLAAENADVVIPFASIDPHAGAAGAARVRTLVEHHGVRGFKFHPNVQAFFPGDRAYYPLYEAMAETGLPVVFHTGHTGVGAGQPGGGGIRLKFSNPMAVDDVAVDFPEMPIVLAHPSFPWQDEAISVALHKTNVYIDLSGWSPKYFPANLVQYANTLLKEKVLFGSDYPVITPDRWLADFEQLPIKPEVRPLILKENAVRLLGLG
ncbi:MAG TPA: amidohydrolase family protein [Acidimicrobiia bacterium]|nr:amidohydrolase family protein [Acidimicrobiia bacterium]